MRHAKAEPYATTDHDRRLSDRGQDDARSAGRHLRDTGLVPDHAVVSTSERTRMTWDGVASETECGEVARFDGAVYGGGPDAIMEALQVSPDGCRTVLLVGHNPTVTDLCHTLDDGHGEPEPVEGLLRGLRPGALVVFDVSGPWSDLGADAGRICGFWTPSR